MCAVSHPDVWTPKKPIHGLALAVAILKFLIIFEQAALHFHFSESLKLCSWSYKGQTGVQALEKHLVHIS